MKNHCPFLSMRGILCLFFAIGLGFSPNNYAQLVTYTFTHCGATCVAGPTQLQANTSYTGTNLQGSVTVAGGIQSFTVPMSGLYRIECNGAQGGGSTGGASTGTPGGLGARMIGDFN